MGGAISKSPTNFDDTIIDDESKPPSAPISTPKTKVLSFDPRSPSCNIARTPIEVLRTPIPIKTPTAEQTDSVAQINLDPRSPTAEFHRTPIILEEMKLKTLVLRNKNFDNVLTPDVALTPIKPKRNLDRVTKKLCKLPTTPKLLKSSPITEIQSKRNSFIGLLETNLDYVETDLDEVIQSKRRMDCKDQSFEKAQEVLEEVPEPEVELTTESQTEQPEIKPQDEAPSLDEPLEEEEIPFEATLELADTPTDVTQEPLAELSPEPEPLLSSSDNFAARASLVIDELDRKLTNLIYEDKQIECSPKINKLSTNRTPLGDRNLNRKSIPVLRVSDQPRKSLVLSKIPVFKEKEKKVKRISNVQCENTPPRMMTKRSQWGAEDSLII